MRHKLASQRHEPRRSVPTSPAHTAWRPRPHQLSSWQHSSITAASTVSSGVPQLQLPAPLQGTTLRFPYLGSGLLFARSTGLKLWPGAQLLAEFMLQPPAEIVMHHPHLSAAALHGEMSSTAMPATAAAQPGTDMLTTTTAASQPATHGMQNAWSWADKSVLELGCGLGLCSTVAALLGARATATDGDVDVVAVAKHNARLNVPSGSNRHPLTAAQLRWGDAAALARLGFGEGSQADVVLLSDVVYGSNPGVWEALVATLSAAAGEHTLVLQAETPRIETPDDYSGYWGSLAAAGFGWKEMTGVPMQESSVHGTEGMSSGGAGPAGKARLWVLQRCTSATM